MSQGSRTHLTKDSNTVTHTRLTVEAQITMVPINLGVTTAITTTVTETIAMISTTTGMIMHILITANNMPEPVLPE